MSAVLHGRARAIRERLAIRAWEYRQRNHSKGVWFRLRRVLVDTQEAFVIDDADVERLIADGAEELPVGHELHPMKRMFFVTSEQAASLASRRSVPVRLGPDLLAATNIALVPHGPVVK